ncbi:hypothetical protein [Falsiroseomonas sp. CW058]|uniref:hypothetical protein n=1 Tax=Falsiroseomonas sp. CW058 TaxID=3388664 RepID=UPI003D311357
MTRKTPTPEEISGALPDEGLPFAEGDLIEASSDEEDSDHRDLPRITPAGSVWRVASIERHRRRDGGVDVAFHVVCPATGAYIVPYLVEPCGSSIRDSFSRLDLPRAVADRLHAEWRAINEIKDLVVDHLLGDGDGPEVVLARIRDELMRAGLFPEGGVSRDE